MTSESSGRGDPARTVALLWGAAPQPRRGPKQALSATVVVDTAIALADADADLSSLSMRRVAERLGVSTMGLYTYVASRAELLEAMVDRAYAEALPGLRERPDDWRAGLRQVADVSWRLYERHPWLLQVFTGRPPLGPGAIGTYDLELAVLDGLGLSDVEMDAVLTVVHTHVEGVARRRVEAASTARRTGLTDAEWWRLAAPALTEVLDPDRFPLAVRVGQAAGQAHDAAHDPEHAYGFGLERLLDGVASLVAERADG